MSPFQKPIPTVAIVVPIYNVERYLPETLNSFLSQTYQRIRIYAVDDGSTDLSGKILDEYAKKDPRIIVIHQKNRGVSSARNRALKQIEEDDFSDYICFIDSDDKLDAKHCEVFINALETTRADYGICGFNDFTRWGLRKSKHSYLRINKVLTKQEIAEHYATQHRRHTVGQSKDVHHHIQRENYRQLVLPVRQRTRIPRIQLRTTQEIPHAISWNNVNMGSTQRCL